MEKKRVEKLLVEAADWNLKKGVNSSCHVYLFQPKLSDSLRNKLRRFKENR